MILPHFPFVPTPDSEEWQDKQKRYDADKRFFVDMVEYTDKLVGKIIKKTKELGIAENTLIIFTSDNGTHRPIVSQTRTGPYRGGKAKTIDAGTHVPLFAYWPGQIEPGSVYDGLIGFSDFYPTFAEMAGKNVESDGRSFLPLLKDEPYKERETVLVHYDPMHSNFINQFRGRFVRTKEYKLYQNDKFYHIPTDKREEDPISMEHVSWDVMNIREHLQKILDQAPEWQEKEQ
jgi:arylsulfatase A